jgi:hypothetical protein
MLKVFWLLFILLHSFLFHVTCIQAGLFSSAIGHLAILATEVLITGGGLISIRLLNLNHAVFLLVGYTLLYLVVTGVTLAAFGTSHYEALLPLVFACGLLLSGSGLAFKFKTDALSEE